MRDLLVLCYHALSDDWPATLCVRTDRFEQQLELLLGRGYEPLTFSRAVLDPPSGKAMVVTFDDAFRSVLELGLPVLERLGVPATVFAVTAFADGGRPLAWAGIDQWPGGPHEDELASMSWQDLRGLEARGWEVGSHTRTHPRLTSLTDAQLVAELDGARADCAAALGHECDAIAYPYGDVDARVVKAAQAAGYRAGAALPSRVHRGHPLEWPRAGIYWNDDLGRFRLKVSRAVRAGRMLVRR